MSESTQSEDQVVEPVEENEKPPELSPGDKRKADVRRAIVVGSKISSPYLIMNGLATAVAGYGLLANSTAVVIGAMIIAMLLGPIMGLALALVDGDTRLLRDAAVAEVIGAAMVVGIGLVLGWAHRDIQISTEILSRTHPNLLDLAIAIFGGAAGAYATVSPRVSVGLVGVAISTALVPPLASCGICLSRGMFPEAAGAFILFATNLVAIQCASSAVLFLFGYHRITRRDKSDPSYLRRLVIDGMVLLVLGAFLYRQLNVTIGNQKFERQVQAQLERRLRDIPGAYLRETRIVEQGDRLIVVAVVHAPNSITPEQTEWLQRHLGRKGNQPIELHVRSLLTKEATAEGYLHVIEPESTPVDIRQDPYLDLPEPLEDAMDSLPGAPTSEPSANPGNEMDSPTQTGQPGTASS
ncbi:MAG: TIGR00341 family protein [Fimbriimonadaceae bacterium]